ncbi:GNAT family N-acetyltransferase [Flavobacterium soli]|uniref:GNAT family N-acetyltransferase n=1 Tax=Flavobacterium soli TaxID=344881 RepID=UPI00041311DE|nr:GNAT family N-acetyltransferase [Flavobacterium soli]
MKEPFFLTTQRTILRNLTTEYAADFYTLNLDPEVLQFTGDTPFESIAAAKDFLTHYDQFEKYGVGRFAVLDKSTLQFMGWCGLKYSKEKNEYDIGFRFFKGYWNQGFATETARRCLDFGCNELGLQRIVGRAMSENVASIKVLEKLGMTFTSTFDFDGQEGVLYEFTKKNNK